MQQHFIRVRLKLTGTPEGIAGAVESLLHHADGHAHHDHQSGHVVLSYRGENPISGETQMAIAQRYKVAIESTHHRHEQITQLGLFNSSIPVLAV